MGPVRDGLRAVQSSLEEYIQKLRLKCKVHSVVLFGSRARGDHWENSDIDLLVISPDFAGLNSGQRIDLLLELWPGIPALEPFGVTPIESVNDGWLLLWDALYQGRVLEDDGTYRLAREKLMGRIRDGALTPTLDGWRERLEPLGRG